MSTTSKFKKLAGLSAFAFAAMTAANSVNAANWRYAHEEYEGDVQDVFAYDFKEYIEDIVKSEIIYKFRKNLVIISYTYGNVRCYNKEINSNMLHDCHKSIEIKVNIYKSIIYLIKS